MKLSDSQNNIPHSAPNLVLHSFKEKVQESANQIPSDSQELNQIIQSKDQIKQNKAFHQPTIVCNITDTRYPVVKRACRKLGMKIQKKGQEGNNWDLCWTDNAVQPEELGKMNPHQKINHFPGMFCLSRKNHLGRNLMKMRKKFQTEYDFFPLTWMFPSQRSQLRAYAEKNKKNLTFIVKPEASCQGKGIFLVKNIDDIPQGQHYVVQKYLNKPFLIDNLKFDFRIYVLLAGCSPMRIYLYDQGLARFATEKYVAPNRDNIDVSYMHLTNYAVNKGNDKFVYNQSDKDMTQGHKRSLTSTMKLIGQMGYDSKLLWEKIKDMIVKTIISGQPILSHHYKSCQPDNYANNMCFQILGFDVMLDSDCNPYVLEVNYTPSFTTDTPLDKTIKLNLIRDTIQLMNLTSKAKKKVISENKQIMMKRMLSGKRQKLTIEQREQLIADAQKKRDRWQNKHLGGFQKIYPCQNQSKYTELLKHAEQCYLQQTGANIKRNSKKQKQVIVPFKKQTTTQQLSKIYNKSVRPKTAIKKFEIPSKRQHSQAKLQPFDKILNSSIEQKKPQILRKFKSTLYERKESVVIKILQPKKQKQPGIFIQPRLFQLGAFGN